MPIFISKVSVQSAVFKENQAAYTIHEKRLEEMRAWVAPGGRAAALERHTSRGKLFARDRIQTL
ncbi:MAG TPA: methylcrotonoyl-CoA carboxylase, partial [Turneriella sp.]|nr:methylcrotonoyl-CoA carboxylase [Turneriella sp.]